MATLYVVATPIGNLRDMTPRAVDILQSVKLIAAEDTRVTQRLLSFFEIKTPLTSCYEHNQRSKAPYIVRRMLEEDMDVALTTDAGTPCISDPGSVLVREAAIAEIPVLAIPGPSAMAAALSVSGMDVTEFTFYGFLPRGKGELKEKLLDIARHSKISVVHESPHRVIDLLTAVYEMFPRTEVSASCDLTKKYELTLRGNVREVLEALKANPKAEKGEYCLVLQWHREDIPPLAEAVVSISLEARLTEGMLQQGLTLRESMETLVGQGERKNAVYAAGLRVKNLLTQL